MTSATLAMWRPNTHRDRSRRGFTLVGMLTVMGIIVLLAALGLPMLFKVWKSGQRTKAAADFQVIGTGLEAYKQDFGDYPRPDSADRGAALLCRELLGPFGDGDTAGTLDNNDPPAFNSGKLYKAGEAVRVGGSKTSPTYVALRDTSGTPGSLPKDWVGITVNDYADGPGTRVRSGGASRGPYLQPDKVRFRGCVLLDPFDNPILYFVASPAKPNVTQNDAYVAQENRTANPPVVPLYDANQNFEVFRRSGEADAVVLRRMRALMGDTNDNGGIDSGETQLATTPYILWSAGNDGLFGFNGDPTDVTERSRLVAKCDDVTNFK